MFLEKAQMNYLSMTVSRQVRIYIQTCKANLLVGRDMLWQSYVTFQKFSVGLELYIVEGICTGFFYQSNDGDILAVHKCLVTLFGEKKPSPFITLK